MGGEPKDLGADEARIQAPDAFVGRLLNERYNKLRHYLRVEKVVLPDMQERIFNLIYEDNADERAASILFLSDHDIFSNQLLEACLRLVEHDGSDLVRVAASTTLVRYYLLTKDKTFLEFIVNKVIRARTQPNDVRVGTYINIIGPAKLAEHGRGPRGLRDFKVDDMDMVYLDMLLSL